MAKYKIIPSSRTIVQSPISIGHKAEKGVEAIEFDVTAWVETYGSGTLTVIMRRWGDAIPYPIALEIDENNKATWVLSDTDTAKAGMAYAQLSYIVGETVVKKSDIYTFRVMDSLTGEGEPPEAYESWLEHLQHLAAEAMAEVLDIEGVATDKTLTVDGGIADAKATGDALALKADKSTTYTKAEVDQMIEDVKVETDTTLEIDGAPADAAETGRQIGLLKADLETLVGGGIEQREIQFVYGTFINDGNAAEIGETVDLTNLTEWYSLKHAIVECQEGDEFLIDMAGATNARAWAFLTSNNVLLSRSNENETVTGKITAPQNAGKVIIQGIYRQTPQDTTDEGTAYKLVQGTGKVVRFDISQDLTDSEKAQARENIGVSSSGMTDAIKEALLACFEHVAWVDEYGQDYYDALELALYDGTPQETHEYIYPNDGKTIVIANKQLENGYASDNGAYLSNNTNRAVVCSNTGEHSISLSSASAQETSYYPIPIPDDATSVKIELSPSTLYCYASIVKYDSSKATGYVRALEQNWAQSGVTINFAQGIGTGLVLNLKANSAGTGAVSVNSVKITYSKIII